MTDEYQKWLEDHIIAIEANVKKLEMSDSDLDDLMRSVQAMIGGIYIECLNKYLVLREKARSGNGED